MPNMPIINNNRNRYIFLPLSDLCHVLYDKSVLKYELIINCILQWCYS